MVPGRQSAHSRHSNVGKFYTAISLYAISIWSLYAIVWLLGDVNQVLSVDTGVILFAIVLLLCEISLRPA